MFFYTVLTKFPDSLELNLMQYCIDRFSKFIIVKEFGESGNNPHYNIVYEVLDDKQLNYSKNNIKSWRRLYPTDIIQDLPTLDYLVKTKKCPTYQNVIGGYLTKEQKSIILHNQGFDIDACIQNAEINIYLNDTKINNVYEFVDNKIMPFRDNSVYEDAYHLCNRAYNVLFQNNDLSAIKFIKYKMTILQIVKSRLDQELSIWSALD